MTQENKAVVQRWFDEVWNAGRADAIDELSHLHLRPHGLLLESGDKVESQAKFKIFHSEFLGAFSDVNITVEDMVAESDKVAARCSVRATRRADLSGNNGGNKQVEFTGITIVRIEDGKIAEAWNEFDFLKLFQQIGAA